MSFIFKDFRNYSSIIKVIIVKIASVDTLEKLSFK